jgi:predicted unusual protein kinase regulating ubiquinone biosynthesis (AarF/ABC1/UbiB family)
MTRYLTAIYSGDVERMFHALRQFLVAGPHADPEKFHDRFVAETRTFMRTRADEPRPAGERSPFVQYLIAVVRAARESDMRIPAHLLSMYRTLVTAESVAQKLGADAQLRDIGRAFFARLQLRNSVKVLEPPQAQALGADLLAIAKDGPGFVHRILSDLADERFLLHVRATQTREDRIEANRRARLVSASVLTVALSILLASTKQIPGLSSFPYATPVLGALLAMAVIYVLLIWRRLS